MAGFDTSVPLTAPDSYPPPPHHAGDPSDAEFGCTFEIDYVQVAKKGCTHAYLATVHRVTKTLTYFGGNNESPKINTMALLGEYFGLSAPIPSKNGQLLWFLISSETFESSNLFYFLGGWDDLHKTLENDFAKLKQGLNRFVNPSRNIHNDPLNGYRDVDPERDACEKMVLQPLTNIGLDIKDFLGYLQKGNDFYDGTTSTLTVGNALDRNYKEALSAASASMTVGSAFSNPRNKGFDAITSYSLSQTRFTVFFNTRAVSSVGLLFHEALHGYGAFLNRNDSSLRAGALAAPFSDDKIKSLFGITTSGSNGITEYIDKHCGDYFKNK
jgi:hypothetical protein